MSDVVIYFFFFSSRRRHTRLQGDWSSDVCSSDLHLGRDDALARVVHLGDVAAALGAAGLALQRCGLGPQAGHALIDWERVGEGKRVDLGGGRIFLKKKKIETLRMEV